MPPNTVCVTRPGKWSNPFRVGGWFQWKPCDSERCWREADRPGKSGYTLIADKATAVAWFSRMIKTQHRDVSELRGRNLACWCKLGEPCHADWLLHFANTPIAK